MAYVSLYEDFQGLGASCGGRCQCGPCRQHQTNRAALAEWYELDEDEPEPPRTAAKAPPPAPAIGGVMYRQRGNGLGSPNGLIAAPNYPAQWLTPGQGGYPALGELPAI